MLKKLLKTVMEKCSSKHFVDPYSIKMFQQNWSYNDVTLIEPCDCVGLPIPQKTNKQLWCLNLYPPPPKPPHCEVKPPHRCENNHWNFYDIQTSIPKVISKVDVVAWLIKYNVWVLEYNRYFAARNAKAGGMHFKGLIFWWIRLANWPID